LKKTHKPFYFLIPLTLLSFSASSFAQTQSVPKINAVVHEAGAGKTFSQVLESIGFTRAQADHLLSLPIIPFKMHLNQKEKFLVVNDPANRSVEGRFYLDYSDEAMVFKKQNEAVQVKREPINFKVIKKNFEGLVSGGIIESIKRLVPDDWAAFRFMDAFSWDMNFKKGLQKNDSYKFSIEEKYDQGVFVKYGEITQAELNTHGSTLRRYLWQNDLAKVFVDPHSRFQDRPFYAPVDYLHISSPFAKRRFHPVRHNFQPHLGVDFALNEGAPIYAARDGIIEQIDHHHANGNFIQIKHDQGFLTTYNHMGRWAPNLHEGQLVKAGEIIGYVGCTGYCTSPHLDFRIRKGDFLYDPMALTKPYPYKERNYFESSKFKNLISTFMTKI
jgi:murein DD-endopeptidase MepM/ murein hydrolase activator NlpD